ncbi:MAG TPA: preprotein translocase subunit SecG [Dehalococcoidia bacterium]|jgi:protein translocase SecG subunit|nr:preprotein translocase subunit SecG [Dehalococcoidia bacterium]
MELKDFLAIGQIIIAITLIALVLMQVRGTGFGAALGGQDYSFRTRRGVARSLHRITILTVVLFLTVSAWSVIAG